MKVLLPPRRKPELIEEFQIRLKGPARCGEIVPGHDAACPSVEDERVKVSEVLLTASANVDVLLRQHVAEERDDLEAPQRREFAAIRHRGAFDRKEKVERHGIDFERLEGEREFEHLSIRLPDAEDSPGANGKPGGFGRPDRLDPGFIGVSGANPVEVTPGRFQIVMVPGNPGGLEDSEIL